MRREEGGFVSGFVCACLIVAALMVARRLERKRRARLDTLLLEIEDPKLRRSLTELVQTITGAAA